MTPTSEGTLQGVGGARLAWVRWDAEEPVGLVVIVHGLGDHAGRYELVAGSLVTRGLSVFAYDQRGHGRSQGIRGHAASFDQLISDLDHAIGLATSDGEELPVFLWGHSMGGLLVIRYLQGAEPVAKGAVITSPWLATAAPVPAWKRLLARVLDRVAPWLALSTGVAPEALMRDPERLQAYRDDPLVHDRISPRLYHRTLEAQYAARAEVARLRTPALFLVPEDDPLVMPAATIAFGESIPGGDATVAPLAGLLHEPHNEPERGEVFLRAGDWIDRVLAR